jgi:hypothetical protein
MMQGYAAALLWAALPMMACAARSDGTSGLAATDTEEPVLIAALQHLSKEAGGLLLVETVSRPDLSSAPINEWIVPVAAQLTDTATAADFQRRNHSPRRIAVPQGLEEAVHPIELPAVSSALSSPSGWQALRDQNPNLTGIVRISRPGFDRGQERAVTLVELLCGPGCRNGRMFRLEHAPSGWRVTATRALWVN